MYVVFYAHPDDAKLAELLADYLDFGEREPIQSIRQLVEGATDVRQAVRDAFVQIDVLVVLISPAWLRSVSVETYNPGAVENVILKAFLQREKPIIPILLKGVRQLRILDIHGEIDRLADIQAVPLNLEDALATIQAVVKGTMLTGKSVLADSTRSLADTVGLPPVVAPRTAPPPEPEREYSPLRRIAIMTISLVILLFVAYGSYLVGRSENDADDQTTSVVNTPATEAPTEAPIVIDSIGTSVAARTQTASAIPLVPTASLTLVPSITPTSSPSQAPTETQPPTATLGPTETYTPTTTRTPTQPRTPSITATFTPSPTALPSETPTSTPTDLPTEVAAAPIAPQDALTEDTVGDAQQVALLGRGAITHGGFSADGSRFAAATFAAVWLYDMTADPPRYLTTFEHGGAITSMAFSSDGIYVATGGFDRAVRVWNADTNQFITDFTQHDGAVYAIAFSDDSTQLASASEDIFLYAPQPQASVRTFSAHQARVVVLAFSADGSRLASGDIAGRVIVWDVATGTIDAELGHSAEITDLAFASNNALLLTSTADGVARYWDIATQAELGSLSPAVNGIAWLGNRPAALRPDDGGQATLLDVSNGDILATWQTLGSLKHVYFADIGQAAVVWQDDLISYFQDPTLSFPSATLVEHQNKATRIATSPVNSSDNPFGMFGTTSGALAFFRPDANIVYTAYRSIEVPLIAVSVGDGVAAGITQSGDVLIYAPINATDVERVIPLADLLAPRDVDIVGDQVAVATSEGVVVLNGRTGETILAITGPTMTAIAWSPTGDAVAAAGSDGTIYAWEVPSGTPRFAEDQSGRDILALDWSGDDLIVAGGRDNNIVIRDAQSGAVAASYSVGFAVESIAVSPQGWLIAVGAQDPAGTVLVFDTDTGDRVAALAGHVGFVYDVAWSADGSLLYSTGQDGTLRAWGLRE